MDCNSGNPALGERPHDFLNTRQLAAQAAARMKTGKILRRKAANLAQHQGQRVADRQHGGRAGGGGQAERARFRDRAQIERYDGVFRQRCCRLVR